MIKNKFAKINEKYSYYSKGKVISQDFKQGTNGI